MKASSRISHFLRCSALWLAVLGVPRLAWASGMANAGGMIFVTILFILVVYPLAMITPVSAAASIYMLIKYRRAAPSHKSGIWARRLGRLNVTAAILLTVGTPAVYGLTSSCS